jgi:hypothetical protein
MNNEDLLKQAKRIVDGSQAAGPYGAYAEATEFLRVYAGERSIFFQKLHALKSETSRSYLAEVVGGTLNAFIRFVENGLIDGISIERKAQIDVVSDFLEQANVLLDSKEVHPAAPTVIIGASLEEFLRTWIEEASLDLEGQKPGLDTYAKVLREAELITKQDIKDITSWGGLRNHAAHGGWDEVNDRSKISIMLDGVNLFMRKYGKKDK